MTKEALQEQHRMIIVLNNGSSEDATKLSIQYAIEVLGELKGSSYQIITDDNILCLPMGTIVSKITELKSLLK